MMLSRKDIPYIKQFDNASEIFGNTVDIKGGVNYFLKDINYIGQCNYNNVMLNLNDCDILIESKYLPLINKISIFPKLNNSYRSKGYYGIALTDQRLHDICKIDDDIKCYVSQMKGFIKYIQKDTIKNNTLGKWQIITPSAAHGAFSGFGNLIIGNQNEVYSETYISFAINTEMEAKSLLSYMNCRLPNMLLSLRKISHNISNDTCKWIPLPPLNLNIEWTDDEVYKYFKLSVDDIKLINDTNIIGYKNNKIINDTTNIIEDIQEKPKKVIKRKSPTKKKEETFEKDEEVIIKKVIRKKIKVETSKE